MASKAGQPSEAGKPSKAEPYIIRAKNELASKFRNPKSVKADKAANPGKYLTEKELEGYRKAYKMIRSTKKPDEKKPSKK